MRYRALFFCLTGLCLAVFLSSCGEHRAPPGAQAQAGKPSRGYYKIGSPYQVDGVWYYPGVDYSYDETGIASWYGPDFHGKYTANGETYDMNDLTAAHPTLPMPSVVRVTNLENGRSIIVRVNDRGPYVRGRIIDLSRRAAQLLGVIGPGTAKVRVQIMADESRQVALLAQQGEIPSVERLASAVPTTPVTAQALPPPPGIRAEAVPPLKSAPVRSSPPPVQAAAMPPPAQSVAEPRPDGKVTVVPVTPTSIYVQVGAFGRYDNADRLKAKLSTIGPTRVSQANVNGQPFFRVRMGPAQNVADADRLLDLVVRAGYHDARIVVE